MVCGQTRQADMQRLRERYPKLLTPAGDDEVDVIVATQSLEVGVDLDLASVVTELASGSALAQRAGRVNRRGLRERGPVVVVVPAEPLDEKARSGPYAGGEIAAALDWLRLRSADSAGLAPWAVQADPPPSAERRRMLYQRPELADAWHWARTSDDLAAEPELDLWIAESFDDENSVGVVVRDALPQDADEAVELLRTLPPRAHEVFPVPLSLARTALPLALASGPAYRLRGEDIAALPIREIATDEKVADVRPGDVAVIDANAKVFTGGRHGADFSPHVVTDLVKDRGTASDVLHTVPADRREVSLRLDLNSTDQAPVGGLSLGSLDEATVSTLKGLPEMSERERRGVLARFLDAVLAQGDTMCASESRQMVVEARRLMFRAVKASDVVIQADADGEVVRVMVVDRRRAGVDENLRQVFSIRAGAKVTLDDHQSAVAGRAAAVAASVGLPDVWAEALRLAGEHHDDGKAHPRFQIRLGRQEGDPVLAKSDPASTVREVSERERLADLPRAWRHEQRSVLAWLAHANGAPLPDGAPDADLVSRLIGTSHGHGRSGFPHPARVLLDAGDDADAPTLAAAWFDHGGWDELIERTNLRYGVWGCAYLEALLRAADGQVSGEGS
jgi:CRISPR-associated endonuclease/helicase Cas3